MHFNEILESLKPSEYRPFVQKWDKSRYATIFANSRYKHDKNAYRVFIPVIANTNIEPPDELRDFITSKGYTISDYNSGIVTDQYNRRVKIGKVLSKEKAPNSVVKSFTNDINRSKTTEYYLIISRHPYDIAGMSTNRGWDSCMNLHDGENAHYVPMDIKYGTIIAYQVRKSDPDIKNPMGRVLIKPFVNVLAPDSQDIFLGIEKVTYGTFSPETMNKLVKWVDEINAHHTLNGMAVFTLDERLYNDSRKSTLTVVGKETSTPADLNDYSMPQLAQALAKTPYLYSYVDWSKKTDKDKYLIQRLLATTSGGFSELDNPSEEIQVRAVKFNPNNIKYINNPTVTVQKAAIKTSPYAIKYINNPSEEIQQYTVRLAWDAIEYIDNPSEEIQLIAVKQDVDAIEYIDNPTPTVLQYVENNS